ncbi:autotransporter outer membrane beta-barrel domain-containing protein [Dyella japonica]|uniref:Autotransporter protein n=1 Tax=Dyella japonica A8 TaxID=1217721 RepID=A0A075K3I8_9GAMM|nr:autotransporter domain-containing protein [Dyella japonica]AIF48277.1 autotransporter protein [Dyella japonica A8]
MRKIQYRPLALALACAFSTQAWAQTSDIPLDIIQENYGGGQFGYRLGINVGVNGAQPQEYLFDTGSDSFNIDVGLTALHGSGPAWFPTQAGTATGPLQFYLYGDGTYGYLQASTTVASMQFYNSTSGAQVANFATPGGAPVAVNYAYVTSTATGAPVGTANGVTLKIDTGFQQNLANGVAPEEGVFYGIVGAGDFGNGVPGMLSKSGYIVEANGGAGVPGNCGSGCLILGLTPALRAQFLSVVPWIGGAQGTFALSGAPSANQFDTQFMYALSDGKTTSSASLPTLFDTGTPNIMLIDNGVGLLSGETAAGHINANGDEVPGITLTATGVAPGAQPSSVLTGDDSSGDYTNVVTVGPYGGFPNGAIYGIGFFFRNAVMYDLQNQATGYTPFYVTDAAITTGFTVTSAMGPLGLAGVISGTGPFTVAAGGIVNLSGTNTYTGATVVNPSGWLGIAGPGSIASSSDVHIDGVLDISRASQATTITSLSGAGLVQLGGNVLMLTHASGNFAGQLADGGLSSGGGGGLVVSSGREVLSGQNTYTGATGIAAQGELDLSGSLAGGVLNLGVLGNTGSIGGSVVNQGWLANSGRIAGSVVSSGLLTGQGHIGGSLSVSGTVMPTGPGFAVTGNYLQAAGSNYLAPANPGQPGDSSQIVVGGQAALAQGAVLTVGPAPAGEFYTKGARYTVLTANQGVTGTYTLGGNTTLSAVLGIATAYDAQHVYLDVVQNRSLGSVGATRNEVSTLNGVQSLAANNAIFAAVANLPSDAAIRSAADQLQGDIHASARGTFLEDSHFIRDAVNGRLSQLDGGGTPSASSADASAANGLAWWGQFLGSWGHRDSNGNAAAVSRSLGGFVIGADMPVGEYTHVGALGGYTQTSLQAASHHSSDASDDAHVGLYAGSQWGAWGLRGGVAYSGHSFDSTRGVAFGTVGEQLLGHGKASTEQAFAEGGYLMQWRRMSLEPFAQAAYVRLHSDGFTEHGGAAALRVQGDDDALTYGTLGARAATHFQLNGDVFDAHAMLGWRHAFGQVNPQAQMGLAGGDAFAVDGVPLARDVMVLDVGLSVPVTRHANVSLAYNGQVGHRVVDSGFRGGFVWKF